MVDDREHRRNISHARLGIDDPEFQKKWLGARDLDRDQVDTAYRHGFDAAGRFAERTFDEVENHLRESWRGMAPSAEWDEVRDIVRAGYSHADGGVELGQSAELPPDALDRFGHRTTGGSAKGGTMGEQTELGAAERASEYEGEGGRPVADGRRVEDERPSRPDDRGE